MAFYILLQFADYELVGDPVCMEIYLHTLLRSTSLQVLIYHT
jgi:hypothetical protein